MYYQCLLLPLLIAYTSLTGFLCVFTVHPTIRVGSLLNQNGLRELGGYRRIDEVYY